MIPMLLWRCPLCATNDALVHISRCFRPDLVRCTHCDAVWRVRRVPGDNYYLRVAGSNTDAEDERSIAEWYDVVKRSVGLVSIDDPGLTRECGEVLYLGSGAAELQAEETDPLFFPGQGNGLPKVDKREIGGVVVGRGRLFLTNRRIVWQAEHSGDGKPPSPFSFSLSLLNSVHAMMDYGLALLVGIRLYAVYLPEESVLKWVTYSALVARQVLAETGHVIATSHY